MMAYRLIEAQQPPQLQDVPKPSPGPRQLLIKVGWVWSVSYLL
jgi:D-arabinose 1-dehydrogenase-like Zn-dependent alcohol dehydrogenase